MKAKPEDILIATDNLLDAACDSLGDCSEAERDIMTFAQDRFKALYLGILKERSKNVV